MMSTRSCVLLKRERVSLGSGLNSAHARKCEEETRVRATGCVRYVDEDPGREDNKFSVFNHGVYASF